MEIKFKKFQLVEKVLVIQHTYDELKDSCDYDQLIEHESTLFICKDEEEALDRLKKHIESENQILDEDVASWDSTRPFLISGSCTYELRKARLVDVETVDAEQDRLDQMRLNREYMDMSFFVHSPSTITGVVLFDGSMGIVSKNEVTVECNTGTIFTVRDKDIAHYGKDHITLFLNRRCYAPSECMYIKAIYLPRDGKQIRELYEQRKIQITR